MRSPALSTVGKFLKFLSMKSRWTCIMLLVNSQWFNWQFLTAKWSSEILRTKMWPGDMCKLRSWLTACEDCVDAVGHCSEWPWQAADRVDSACQLPAANSIRYCSNNNIARRQVEIGGGERSSTNVHVWWWGCRDIRQCHTVTPCHTHRSTTHRPWRPSPR